MDNKAWMVDSYIELKCGSRWQYIACERDFIQNSPTVTIDQVKGNRVAIIVSELLEDAVKYTIGEYTEIRMHFSQEIERILISAENNAFTESMDNPHQVFKKVIQGDPLKVYISHEISNGRSQPVFARIRYGTGGDLDLSIKDNLVRMSMNMN